MSANQQQRPLCIESGCDRPARTKGKCNSHYSQGFNKALKAARFAEGLCMCGKPLAPERKKCTDCCAKAARRQSQYQTARVKKGKCAMCSKPQAKGRTLCDTHLELLRANAKVRDKSRKDAGLCRRCGRPSELGQVYCLIHRQVKEGSARLPHPVARVLNNLRSQRELEAANAKAKAAREIVDKYLWLLDAGREREIMQMRYGYTNAECKTLQEVGDHFGVTRERIRQLQLIAETIIYAAAYRDRKQSA